MVDVALNNSNSPIYVRHEIVHNKRVVNDLRAIFVKELEELLKVQRLSLALMGYQKK